MGDPPREDAPAYGTPIYRPPATSGGKKGFPALPLLVVLALVLVYFVYRYIAGGEMRQKIREATLAVEGISPDEMMEKLLSDDELPEVIPLEVEGVLDLRLGLYMCEYPESSFSQSRIPYITSIKVYGLLYPSGCGVWIDRDTVRSFAEEAEDFLAESSNIDTEEYITITENLQTAYSETCGDAVVLVELSEDAHPQLYKDVEKIALEHVNRGRGGPAYDIRDMADSERLAVKHLLDTDNLRQGAFTVQIVAHEAALADEVSSEEPTKGVEVSRTVKEVP